MTLEQLQKGKDLESRKNDLTYQLSLLKSARFVVLHEIAGDSEVAFRIHEKAESEIQHIVFNFRRDLIDLVEQMIEKAEAELTRL